MVRQSLAIQRRNATMLRAMHQFIVSHPNMAFKKKATELNVRSVQRVADFLLLKRSEMNHPDPRKAAPFALLLVGFMLQKIIVFDVLPACRTRGCPRPTMSWSRNSCGHFSVISARNTNPKEATDRERRGTRGQVFVTAKGCHVWSIAKVSVGRPLTAQELIASA